MIPEYIEGELGVELSEDILEHEVGPVRARNPHKDPRGPQPVEDEKRPRRSTKSEPAIWTDWLRIDEAALGLQKYLLRIPNDGMPLPDLIAFLEELPGVTQLIETAEDREIIAVVIQRSAEEADDLQAVVQEHAPTRSVRLHRIRRESDAPIVATWLDLAARELDHGRRAEGRP